MIRFGKNSNKLLFNDHVYEFEQTIMGSMALTFILTQNHQKFVLKLMSEKTSESEILPYLQTNLPKEFKTRVSQIISSGTCSVDWNGYIPGSLPRQGLSAGIKEFHYVHLSYLPGEMLSPKFIPKLKPILFSFIDLLLEINRLSVFHLDIRIENVVIDSNDQISLIDFGQSSFLTEKLKIKYPSLTELDSVFNLLDILDYELYMTILDDPQAEMVEKLSDPKQARESLIQLIKTYL